MTGMKSEPQSKNANRHTVPRKLLVKTKTFLTFGITLKLTTKKARSPQLAKEAEFVQFPEAHRNKRSGNFKTKSSHQLRL